MSAIERDGKFYLVTRKGCVEDRPDGRHCIEVTIEKEITELEYLRCKDGMNDAYVVAFPAGVGCEGCGCQIPEDDEPNLIIGKNPVQFCSKCVEFSSLISRDGSKWKVSPVKTCDAGQMDFSSALRALKSGKIVRNANWNGKGMYLTILNPPESIPAIYLCMPDDHPHYPHQSIPWTPSQLDLMSEDWEVVQ